MSYTPTQWNTGDTITASALNKIENGIANAGAGIGVDAEVYVYHSASSEDSFEFTIKSGNFATLYAMIQDGVPPYILVRMWDELDSYKFSSTLVATYAYGSSFIDFRVKAPTYMIDDQIDGLGLSLNWYADDSMSISLP